MKPKNRFIGLITVRSKSERLPNKCFYKLGKKTVLEHIIARLKFYQIETIICTTDLKSDDKIVEIANKNKVKYYRGSVKNKLLRWYDCCVKFKIDFFHTIDADDPYFDGILVKKSLNLLKKNKNCIIFPSKYASSGGATYGYSINRDSLEYIIKETNNSTDTEMIEPFFKKNKNIKIIRSNFNEIKTKGRFTLDYKEDYFFLNIIATSIGDNASRNKINTFLKYNPNLIKINLFRNRDFKNKQRAQIEKK